MQGCWLKNFVFMTAVVVAWSIKCSAAWAQNIDCSTASLFAWLGSPEQPDSNDPINSDRPNFTEALTTVGCGTMQFESGANYFKNGDSQNYSWGEPLLRYGFLANWLELRVGLTPVTENKNNSDLSFPGPGDFYFGSKLALTGQDGWLPQTAVLTQLTVPTGFGTIPGNTILPSINFLYGWDLNKTFRLTGSSQIAKAAETENDQYQQFGQSVNLKTTVNERLSLYAETFALLPHSAIQAKPEYYVDAGFQYLLSDDVQFDTRIGSGLNGAADDLFAGAGLSFRFR